LSIPVKNQALILDDVLFEPPKMSKLPPTLRRDTALGTEPADSRNGDPEDLRHFFDI